MIRMSVKKVLALCAVALGAAQAAPGLAAEAQPAALGGVVPTGLWVLNQQRSVELQPGKQVLWIVKDNGKHLVWVLVVTDPNGMAKVMSFDGAYDGPASTVVGTGMETSLHSPSPGRLHNEGQLPGVGPYSEDCEVQSGGRRFVCNGSVQAPDGVKRWHDDFDWVGPSPG
jgi:hypothetical protein